MHKCTRSFLRNIELWLSAVGLADRVKNQLAVINMYLPQGRESAKVAQRELDAVHDSIDLIAEQVDSISEESIRDWRRHYAEAVENATTLDAA